MDSGDKKLLNNLMDKLKKLQDNAKEKSAKESKENNDLAKKKTPKKSCTSTDSPSIKKKRNRTENNHPKITSWLNTDSSKTKKLNPLDVSVNKQEDQSKKKKFERSSSFEKYGIVVPSFEKILADQKKFDEHKNKVKAFDNFDDELLEKELNTDCLNETEEFRGELLDCKHLSFDQLNEAFNNHLKTLKDIMNGKKYSERHQRFHKYDVKFNFTSRDLRYSTSLVVFTQDQKDHLLNRMREEMDSEDRKTNYFFKVLLPELCLLIFMDTHDMNKRQANKYLDERPLDI